MIDPLLKVLDQIAKTSCNGISPFSIGNTFSMGPFAIATLLYQTIADLGNLIEIHQMCLALLGGKVSFVLYFVAIQPRIPPEIRPYYQWIFQVPVKGGRDYITP